jgi:hypothetical protein
LFVSTIFAVFCRGRPSASAKTTSPHQEQISHLDYLLAIDRLDFYVDGLADHLMNHEQTLAAEAIRQISPEQY